LTLQVLSAESGKVQLEISGKAQCGSGGFDVGEEKILKRAATEAVNYYPDSKSTTSKNNSSSYGD
jgi:hypothetical protein